MKTKHTGTSIKRLSDNRFGGFLVRFTDRGHPDLHGEYFNSETDFVLSSYPIKGINVLYQHGDDDSLHAVPIAIIDKAHKSKDGIWVEAQNRFTSHYAAWVKTLEDPDSWKQKQLEIAQRYQDMLDKLIDEGHLAWSSGALPKGIQIDDDGHIKRWPIIEGSLTPTPAAPAGTRISTLKPMAIQLFREPDEAREVASSDDDKDAGHHEGAKLKNKSDTKGEEEMEMQELVELIREEIAAYIQELNAANSEQALDEQEQEQLREEITEQAEALFEQDNAPSAETAEEVRSAIAENFSTLLAAGFTAVNNARQAAHNSRAATINNALNQMGNIPLVNPKNTVGAAASAGNGHISVSENMKYAHVSPQEMALAIKLVVVGSVPEHERSRVTFGQLEEHGISDDFVRTFLHKAVPTLNTPSSITTDTYALRSALPFRADELNAVAIASQGAEFAGVYHDTQVWETVYHQTELLNILSAKGMRMVDIPAGSRSVNVKIMTGTPTVFTRSEARNLDSTGRPEVTAQITPSGTREMEVEAQEHVLATAHTYQLDEDSIINLAQHMQAEIPRIFAETIENSMLNGDTERGANKNINLINGTPGSGLSAPSYLAFDGIRKHYLIDYTAQSKDHGNAEIKAGDLEATIKMLPPEISTRRDALLFIADHDVESKVRLLPELLTVDVAGDSRATLFAGTIPRLFNVNWYASGFQELTDAKGKVSSTAATNSRGTLSCVYAPHWLYARKRALTIETERYALSGSTVFVASVRHAFMARGANAAVGRYNIKVS
jgi:hypothetical protein